MTHKITLIWFLLAAITGTALFHTSQTVQVKRKELYQLNKQIASEQEAIRVLAAEWSHLNHPARLEQLAAEHLGLDHNQHGQYVSEEDGLEITDALSDEVFQIKPTLSKTIHAPKAPSIKAPKVSPAPKPARRQAFVKPATPIVQTTAVQKVVPQKTTSKPSQSQAFSDVLKSLEGF